MTIVRELVTLLGFKLDNTGLDKADKAYKHLKGQAGDASAAWAKVGSNLKTFALGALGLAASGAGFVALARHTGEYADQVGATAEQYGLTTDAVQELGYAAQQSSTSMEALGGGLRFLGRNAAEAARGSKAQADAFGRLGVSAVGADGKLKPTDKLLGEVADKFSKMPADGRRVAAAMDLFGRSGSELIPFLANGSAGIAELRAEARQLGGVLDAEGIKTAAEFEDQLGSLTYTFDGLKRAIAGDAIPVIAVLVRQARDWIAANRELVRSQLRAAVRSVAEGVTLLWHVMLSLLRVLTPLFRGVGGLSGVLKLLGVYLGVGFVYNLGVAIMSLQKLSAALAATGNVSLVSQLKVLALPVLIGAAFLALAGLIYLVWDDVTVYLAGGDSALGRLRDSFLKKDFQWEEHPWLKLLQGIAKAADAAIKSIQGLGILLSMASELVAPSAIGSRKQAAEDLGLIGTVTSKLPAGVQSTPKGRPSWDEAWRSGLIVPTWALPSPGAGGTSSSTVAPTANIQVQVDARGATDPAAVGQEVGQSVRTAVDGVWQGYLQDAARALNGPVVR